MNYKYFSELYTSENQFHREKLQYLFDKSFQEKNEKYLRNLYVSLRKLQFNEDFSVKAEQVNLAFLAESITVACDILAATSGISFIFCGGDACYVDGNEKLISKALLNLLSNAYLYGKENLVTVKTVKSQDFSRIEVLSGGKFTNINEKGKGLSYVRKICEVLQGNFLIEHGLSHTKAIMTFRNVKYDFELKAMQQTDSLSLVNDRLSPAYVEMFGMEYH